jgi:hypothetical protein
MRLKRMKSRDEVAEKFVQDIVTHEMEIQNESGVFRHVLFKRPNSSNYHFCLTTWPGYLAISGDMGTYVFRRIRDMFDFFDAKEINPSYWAEKCVSIEGKSDLQVFDDREEAWTHFLKTLLEGEAIEQEAYDSLLGEEPGSWEDVYYLLDNAGVTDIWEYTSWMHEYSFHFLWCLEAIRWGVEQYKRNAEKMKNSLVSEEKVL